MANTELLEVLNRFGLQDAGEITSGTIWFVDSGATEALDDVDGEHGKSWKYPFATIDYAVGRCTANAGDIIYVAAGHAETVATDGALALDVAGISIIGKGNGTLRPTITVGGTGVAAATVTVGADNILVDNLAFITAAVDVTAMVEVNASANFHIKNCIFVMQVTSYEAVTALDIGGVADEACMRTIVEGCEFWADVEGGQAGNATTHAIYISKNASYLQIINNLFLGSFETSCIETLSGEVCKYSIIKDNYGINWDSDNGLFCKMDATEIYVFIGNKVATLVANTVPVTDSSASYFIENYGTDTINTSAIIYPATATAWS